MSAPDLQPSPEPVSVASAPSADATEAGQSPSAPLLRPATRDDVAAIVQLICDGDTSGKPVAPLTEAAMAGFLAAFEEIDAGANEVLLVAEIDGTVVGTCQITFCRTLASEARLRATLEAVHVAPDRRGQGLGAIMVTHAVRLATERGAGIMQLTSNKKRLDAHRFYERLGFLKSHEGFKLDLRQTDR